MGRFGASSGFAGGCKSGVVSSMVSLSHWGLYPAPWYMIADANSMTRALIQQGAAAQAVYNANGPAQNMLNPCYQYNNFGRLD